MHSGHGVSRTPLRSASTPPLLAALTAAALFVLTACGGLDDGGSGADEDAGEGAQGPDQSTEQDQADEQAEHQAAVDQARQARESALGGPGEDHRDQAETLVDGLSTEERAGQVLVGEYSGTDASSMAAQISELHLAGAIIMEPNVPQGDGGADVEALEQQLAELSDVTEQRGYPAVISVDQEGGLVTRVGDPLAEWPTPMAYGAGQAGSGAEGDRSSMELAHLGHHFMGEDLRQLGFTASFAPNGDATVGAEDPTMGARSFGSDADAVADLALAGTRGLAESGLAGSVKHFPGHGSVTEDSHETLPVQDASLEQLQQRDWQPFAQAAEAGVPMIMMGHIDVPALEEGVPSSLSAPAYEQLREMGHDGVVVTDALNMGAIVRAYGADQAPVMALQAGADLLLMPSDVAGAHQAIVAAVESGQVAEERLTEAAERVVALMLWQQDLADGELDAGPGVSTPPILREADDGPPSVESGEHSAEETAAGISRAAVTMVTGQCGEDLAAGGIRILGGEQQDRSRLSDAAEDAGVPVGQGLTVNLLGGSRGVPGGDVAVALDRPEALDGADAPTQIALYGRTEASFGALIEVLAGEQAPGALPVSVGEHDVGHTAC